MLIRMMLVTVVSTVLAAGCASGPSQTAPAEDDGVQAAHEESVRTIELGGTLRVDSFHVAADEVVIAVEDLIIVSEGDIVLDGPILGGLVVDEHGVKRGASVTLWSSTKIIFNAAVRAGNGPEGGNTGRARRQCGHMIVGAPILELRADDFVRFEGGTGGAGGTGAEGVRAGTGGRGGMVQVYGQIFVHDSPPPEDSRAFMALIRGGAGGPGGRAGPGQDGGGGGGGGGATGGQFHDQLVIPGVHD